MKLKNSDIPLIADLATLRQMAQNGFGPTGEAICYCCGEEASEQYVFGSLYLGQMHWSEPYCSLECHDEMHGVATDPAMVEWDRVEEGSQP